jgi:O-antigen/teichoic acid export membrane protein
MKVVSSVRARLEGGIPSSLKQVRQSTFARGLAILTSASLLQTLITLGSAPILSRLFLPEDFGVAGLVQALAVVPLLLANGQYFMAFGIARSRGESINLAFISLFLTTLTAVATVPVVLFLQGSPHLFPPSLAGVAPYLWTIPVFILTTNIVFIARIWEIRHAHYGSMATSRLLETGCLAAAQIGFGLLGAGPLGLIIGRWFGLAAAAVHGLRRVLGQIGRSGLRAISVRRQRTVARRHWRFPAYQLPAAVLNGSIPHLTPLLLGLFYSVQAVGFFWFASRLLERPAIIIGENVGRVFYQHAADRRRDGQAVFGLYALSTGGLAAISVVPFGLVILFGPELFAWMFGAAWETAGHYARWIAVANFTFLMAFPAQNAAGLFGLQKAFAMIETARAVVSALAVILIAGAGGEALVAVAAAAAAQSTTTLAFLTYVGLRLFSLDRGRQEPEPTTGKVEAALPAED